MKKLNEVTRRYEERVWKAGENEEFDELDQVETGPSIEFMEKVKRQLKEIKNFKAAFVRA